MNHQAALTVALTAAERERKLYKKYTEKERYEIGKHWSGNGSAAVCRKLKSNRPILLREIDDMVQRLLLSLKKKGGVVNEVVASLLLKPL